MLLASLDIYRVFQYEDPDKKLIDEVANENRRKVVVTAHHLLFDTSIPNRLSQTPHDIGLVFRGEFLDGG